MNPKQKENNMDTYIKGPWKAYVRQEAFKPTFIIDCDLGMIRPPLSMPRRQIEAHARLIENMPELLDALHAFVLDSECYCCDTGVAAKGPCAYCVAKGVLSKLIL